MPPTKYLYAILGVILTVLLIVSYVMPASDTARCTPGERVATSKTLFEVKIVAIENGQGVGAIMRAAREGRITEPLADILRAVKEGTIARISQPADVTVRIRGLVGPMPQRLALIADSRVCQAMAPVRQAHGEIEFKARLAGDKRPGELSVLLPRALLQDADQAELCIEPKFLLANPIAAGRNMLCDPPGEGALAKAARSNKGGKFYLLIRRPSVQLPTPRYRTVGDDRPRVDLGEPESQHV